MIRSRPGQIVAILAIGLVPLSFGFSIYSRYEQERQAEATRLSYLNLDPKYLSEGLIRSVYPDSASKNGAIIRPWGEAYLLIEAKSEAASSAVDRRLQACRIPDSVRTIKTRDGTMNIYPVTEDEMTCMGFDQSRRR